MKTPISLAICVLLFNSLAFGCAWAWDSWYQVFWEKVFYVIEDFCSWVVASKKELKWVDVSNVEMLWDIYLKHEENVYCLWKKISNVDAKSFQLMEQYTRWWVFAKDKNTVYERCEKIKWADAESFEYLGRDILDNGLYNHEQFFRDVDSIFFYDSKENNLILVKNADVDSFSKILSENTQRRDRNIKNYVDTIEYTFYQKDTDSLFYLWKEIVWADIESFEMLYGWYASDKNHIYQRWVVRSDLDADSFEMLNNEYYVHDNEIIAYSKHGDEVIVSWNVNDFFVNDLTRNNGLKDISFSYLTNWEDVYYLRNKIDTVTHSQLKDLDGKIVKDLLQWEWKILVDKESREKSQEAWIVEKSLSDFSPDNILSMIMKESMGWKDLDTQNQKLFDEAKESWKSFSLSDDWEVTIIEDEDIINQSLNNYFMQLLLVKRYEWKIDIVLHDNMKNSLIRSKDNISNELENRLKYNLSESARNILFNNIDQWIPVILNSNQVVVLWDVETEIKTPLNVDEKKFLEDILKIHSTLEEKERTILINAILEWDFFYIYDWEVILRPIESVSNSALLGLDEYQEKYITWTDDIIENNTEIETQRLLFTYPQVLPATWSSL